MAAAVAVVVEAFSEALLHCAPFLRVPARAQHSATNAPARLFGLATLLTLLVRIADGAGLALAVLAVQLTTAKRRTRLILEVSPERRGARGPLGGHGQTKTAKAAQSLKPSPNLPEIESPQKKSLGIKS